MSEVSKEIIANAHLKEYNQADNIIRYLLNPGDETIQLTSTEKEKLDKCKVIHGYRMKFMKKNDVVKMIVSTMDVHERQAYNLILETEKIFGAVGRVHKEYERQFLLNMSLKNIEFAMAERNSTKITKALLAHYKMAGLEEFVPDMPDFSKLEPHKYIINIPPGVLDGLIRALKAGSIKLSDIIPPDSFGANTEEAQIIP